MSVGGEGPARLMPETIGKYRIVAPIGRGGMGMIFKAHDPILDRQVALKVIIPEVEVSDELRTRFFREAKACAKLNHPNIVTVHDMGEDEGRLFIVMELLQGEELRQIIKADTPLTLEDKLSLMREVCRGLAYAHQQGVVHRDMKPANIFVLKSGHAKILDFGIAQLATTDPGLTRTGLIMGTLRYISPEQVRGRVDHRSDMFSLGSVLYELLTGRPPFLGDDAMQLLEQLRTEEPPPPRQFDPAIPAELEAIVQRAMRKDPAQRFRDLEEMGAALETVHNALIEKRNPALARDRERQRQLAAEQADKARAAREAASQGRNQALALEATSYARELWDAAEARAGEAQAALSAQDSGRAGPLYAEASSLYHRAEESAREARQREHRRAAAARERASEARRRAEALDAEHRAASTWADAVARSAEAEAAWLRKQYARAAERFEAALALYHRAQAEVRDAERRGGEAARARQQPVAESARADVERAAEAATEPRPSAAPPQEAATVVMSRAETTTAPTARAGDDAAPLLSSAPLPREPALAVATGATVVVPEPARPGRSRLPVVVVAIGGVAAIVVAVVVWRVQSPTPSPDQSVTITKAAPTAPIAPATSPPVVTPPERIATPPAPTPTPPPQSVTPPPRPEAPATPSLRHTVEDKLRTAGLLRPAGSEGAGVSVEDVGADGKVRLAGVLKDRAARQAAAELVRTVAGVTAVDVGRVTVQAGWTSQ